MGPIPLVNVVAVIHLFFIAAFFGLFACEAVVETYYSKRDSDHPIAIRMHHLMDIFVELPLMSGIFITGIIMSFLVDTLTKWHFVLIVTGTLTFLGCFFNWYKYVRSRNLEIDKETIDYGLLDKIRIRMGVYVGAVFGPLLFGSVFLGFWLAYHRVVESIYN
jgi:hypothetical protein